MADYVVRFTGQDNLSSTIKNIKNELNSTGSTATKLDQIRDKFNRINNSSAPLKKQLRDIQALMAQMNLNGLSGSEEFQVAAARAGQLKDAISDASKATRLLSSDTAGLDAGIQALQGLSGAAGVATGVMGLLGVENEKTQQAILKVQSVLAIMNGVQSVANALNKDSILMLKLKQIWQNANVASTTTATVATSANTVANAANTASLTASTVAQNAWNVAKAIAKALIGDVTGLILIGAGALLTYALATSDATDKQEKNNEALDEAKKRMQDYSQNVATSAGQLVGKYQLLRNEWNQLKNTGEKVAWIKENANQFQNLGIKVYDLKSAEDVFVNNTNRVVAALQARARAMAAQEMLVDAYKDYYKKNQQADNTVAGGGYYHQVKVGDKVNPDEATEADVIDPLRLPGTNVKIKNQRDADKINDKRMADARKRNQEAKQKNKELLDKQTAYYTNEINEGNKEAKALGLDLSGGGHSSGHSGGGHSGGGGHNTTTTTPPAPNQSLKWYDEQISAIDAKIKLEPDPETAKTLLEQKKLLEKDKEALEIQIGIKEAPIDPNSLSGINKQIDELQKELQLMPDVNTDDAKQKVNQLKELINKRNDIQLKVTPKLYGDKSIKALEEQIKQIDERLANDNLNLAARIVLINQKEQIQAQIDRMTGGEVSIKAPVEPTYISKGSNYDKLVSHQNAEQKVEQVKQMFEFGIIGKDEALEAIQEINDALEALGMKPIEVGNSFNEMAEKQQHLVDIAEAAQQAGQAFADLGNTIGGTAGQAIGAFGQIAATIAQTIGQVISMMMAQGVSSAMALPFPANLAAAATVMAGLASIIATIKSAASGGFADGGIIGGNSFHGDKLLARVNAGEMILNQKQQANLFHQLNGSSGIGGYQVEFKISGSTLKGVLKNYDNKMGKVR